MVIFVMKSMYNAFIAFDFAFPERKNCFPCENNIYEKAFCIPYC